MTTAFIANVVTGLGVCVVLWGLWQAAQPRPFFTVTLSDGIPRATAGTITSEFHSRITEVAAAHAITHGAIRGFAYGGRIRLHFSANIPEPARQQLRNWWATHGWTPPRGNVPKRRA